MILNRLKDIIRSSINDQFDRLKDGDFNFDFDEWKKYDEEYEETRKQQETYERQYQSTNQNNSQSSHSGGAVSFPVPMDVRLLEYHAFP